MFELLTHFAALALLAHAAVMDQRVPLRGENTMFSAYNRTLPPPKPW